MKMGWSEEDKQKEHSKKHPFGGLSYATGLQSKTEKKSKYQTETWESHLDKTLLAIHSNEKQSDGPLIFNSLHSAGKRYTRGSIFKQRFAELDK